MPGQGDNFNFIALPPQIVHHQFVIEETTGDNLQAAIDDPPQAH